MSSVVGKFQLKECVTYLSTDGEGGSGARVKFDAVQSGSWGKYTPSGSIEMWINNPAAAKVFIEAWRKYTEQPTKPGQRIPELPQFYVRFTPADEAHQGQE